MILDKIPYDICHLSKLRRSALPSPPGWKKRVPSIFLDQPSMVSKYFPKLVQKGAMAH